MQKILHITCSTILCLLLVLSYGCQKEAKDSFGSIFGMVSIAGTDEPMRGTGVELYYLENGRAGALLLRTTTSHDGYYEFTDVAAGNYMVRVDVPNYYLTEYTVVVESGRKARVDMQVKPKGSAGNDETDEYCVLTAIGLMVQKNDLGVVSFYSAQNLCTGSIVGGFTDWRLPTIQELQVMYNCRSTIGNFVTTDNSDDYSVPCWYWSSEVIDDGRALVDFSTGETLYLLPEYNSIVQMSVRAVRTVTK